MINRSIIEDLLLEVSVYHPIINFQDKEQVETLLWICEQKGYTNLIPTIKQTLLTEAGAGEEAKKKGLVHLGRGYYGKEKGQAATYKTEDGKLVAIQDTQTAPSSPPSTDDVEAALPSSLTPPLAQSPVQRKDPKEEEKPEDKAKGEHETALEEPDKVLNDPQASMRSKAVARSQQSKNNATQSDAPTKDSDLKGEFKPNPELQPKTDDEGNVEGTDIPAEVKENPDPEFVGKVATKMDEFGNKVLAEEERAQQTVIEQMKKEGKLPSDFKAVGGREMGFGFKHPSLKDNPELQKELADRIKKENKPPHWNLCEVSIPGTNKFCDENIGIPRDKMPQLGGKPKPGSQGEAKAKQKADENVRKKMGIPTGQPIPDERKAEYDDLYSKENISHVNVEKEFEDELKAQGIAVSPPVEVPAASLKATQSELVGEQVVGMVASLEEDPNNPFITAPIMVTKDGYVIDGHHRWAAIQAYNMKHAAPNGSKPPIAMKVRIVDEDIETHIPRANAFAEKMGIETMSGKAKGEQEKTSTTDVKPSQVQNEIPQKEKSSPINREGEPVKKDSFAQGFKDIKPTEEPKVTDDKLGKKATTKGGKTLYHIGGGYYSDSPGGTAKYIRLESVVEMAIQKDSLNWWKLLFEADIKANVEGGVEGTFRQIEKGEQDAATIQAQQAAKQNQQVDATEEEEESTPEQQEEPVEIDLNKLAKDARKREQNLNEKDAKKIKNNRASHAEKVSKKVPQRPAGLRSALKNAINGKPLSDSEKQLLKNWVRIVEPTSAAPNTFRIYVATEEGNFSRGSGPAETRAISVEFGGGSVDGLIRDVMVASGVKTKPTSDFGGKKSTAAQIYTDESGKTRTIKPTPSVVTGSDGVQSIKFGQFELKRLNPNEEGISVEEKLRRERSNRNLDEFGQKINEGKLDFVDIDNGMWPDTAENRTAIIKDSLSKMHDRLFEMAKKAGAKPNSECIKLLKRLKQLSELNPNENSEAWWNEYNQLFYDIAESKEPPSLAESWANVAEIWVTIGEMQGQGKGTEYGAVALLPESTTLETVDVIKVGGGRDEAARTIVTIEGISVKKEEGGASALTPKINKTTFVDKEGSSGAQFKDDLKKFSKGASRKIYGLPNSLEEAKAECSKYGKPVKEGEKKKKPAIDQNICDTVIGTFKNENSYHSYLIKQQVEYANEMQQSARSWEESGRLPKGFVDKLKKQMKETDAIDTALEKIITMQPNWKELSEAERQLFIKKMRAKLENYYLFTYISHVAYNQNVISQDFQNDSVYSKDGKIDVHKSDGIDTISFMKPAFNVGWTPTGRPSNFAAGRLVPLSKNDENGRNFGIPTDKSSEDKQKKSSKTTAKKLVKKSKKKSVREMIQSLPKHIKERIANRLKEQNDEMNFKIGKVKELIRKRISK